MGKYDYKPSMAALIIEMSKKGFLKCEIASALGIPASQLSKWKRELQEFAELMELAETHSMAWWAMRGRTSLENPKFNFYVWYAIMKNAYGWADKPTERNIEFEDWKGTFIEKINNLDQMLAAGKCSTEMYEKMMKSLSSHANINEIIYIQPELAKMDLMQQLKDGSITQDEYTVKMTYIDRTQTIRDYVAENIFKEEKMYSKFNTKQTRKVGKGRKDARTNLQEAKAEKQKTKGEVLNCTEVTIVKPALNPLFQEQADKLHARRMGRLSWKKDGTSKLDVEERSIDEMNETCTPEGQQE